jgi:hypothetical protein
MDVTKSVPASEAAANKSSSADESSGHSGVSRTALSQGAKIANAAAATLLGSVILAMLFLAFVMPRSLVLNSIFDLSKPRTLADHETIITSRQRVLADVGSDLVTTSSRQVELESRFRAMNSEKERLVTRPIPAPVHSPEQVLLPRIGQQEPVDTPRPLTAFTETRSLFSTTPIVTNREEIAAANDYNTKIMERRSDLERTIVSVESELVQLVSRRKEIEEKHQLLQVAFETLQKEEKPERDRYLKAVEEDTDHIYLILRAISLGGIGAFISFMAQISALKAQPGSVPPRYFIIFAAIAVGAVVAIAVIGIFHTKQLSLFAVAADLQQSDRIPDFWRVTIVGLMAGAFADRIFAAATSRVDRYLHDETGPLRPARR